MKILFIENRYSTLLWDFAAEALIDAGHEIFWAVQNLQFKPKTGRVFNIPYPNQRDLDSQPLDEALSAIAKTDRAITHFEQQPAHYPYYRKKILQIIQEVSPDVVFGEATQFHELIALACCKSLGIPFVCPQASRYPTERVFFYLYDTFAPIAGCGTSPSEEEIALLLDKINNRSLIPTYMEPTHDSFLAKLMRHKENARVLLGWIKGERFVTPSPVIRIRLDHTHAAMRARWDQLAETRRALRQKVIKSTNWVLYPLQLQPESNLDVYGLPWINQQETMERAAQSLAKMGGYLVIKPNPKSKYEISDSMVDAVLKHDNIIPLPHSSSMAEFFNSAPMCLSVTGTIILECIFKGKPISVLGSHEMAHLPGVSHLESPEDVAGVLATISQGKCKVASRNDALTLLAELYRTSYDAQLWCPITRPDLFRQDLIAGLQRAFVDLVSNIANKPHHQTTPHPQ